MKKLISVLLSLLIPSLVLADGNVTVIGKTYITEFTPVIDTAAYASGDLIGGKNSLLNTVRPGILSGIISTIEIVDADSDAADIEIVFFTSDPSNTTFTDNAAFAPTDADAKKIICRQTLDDYSLYSVNAVGNLYNINCPFKLTSNSADTLYVALVSKGTPDYATTSDLFVRITIFQD